MSNKIDTAERDERFLMEEVLPLHSRMELLISLASEPWCDKDIFVYLAGEDGLRVARKYEHLVKTFPQYFSPNEMDGVKVFLEKLSLDARTPEGYAAQYTRAQMKYVEQLMGRGVYRRLRSANPDSQDERLADIEKRIDDHTDFVCSSLNARRLNVIRRGIEASKDELSEDERNHLLIHLAGGNAMKDITTLRRLAKEYPALVSEDEERACRDFIQALPQEARNEVGYYKAYRAADSALKGAQLEKFLATPGTLPVKKDLADKELADKERETLEFFKRDLVPTRLEMHRLNMIRLAISIFEPEAPAEVLAAHAGEKAFHVADYFKCLREYYSEYLHEGEAELYEQFLESLPEDARTYDGYKALFERALEMCARECMECAAENQKEKERKNE